MNYKELERLVISGHDIEFEYNNKKYAIVKTADEFYFSEIKNKDSLKVYSNAMELLIKTKVDGKALNDISKDMKEITVY